VRSEVDAHSHNDMSGSRGVGGTSLLVACKFEHPGVNKLRTRPAINLRLVRGQRPSIVYHTFIVILTFGMQSPTKSSQTAAHFAQLPPEILLNITSFADPETCLSLLQVSRSSIWTPRSDIHTRPATSFIHSHIPGHSGSTLFTVSDSDVRY
jgi:hypothetical protein